ncbi:hypothetical protein BIY24_05590 [Halobacteriovorax marinus]|uniref:YaeQ family protein n=1 Tax=Halobacteriovorax marinus TaxID=97084 RepID=UPI000BC2EBCD|nr:YaeQ family protein [Halobacteriovorax marinus]ATH07431.1 hypothetical protein BIY24_05590 [Halobacteriovorax marinus]
MALSATIYKANISLSNLSHNHYEDYSLTMAMHPSENEQRMMKRLLCFLLNASENLEFTRGLSTTEEPEIWERSLTGEILHWIEMGEPTLKRIKQAQGKARQVSVYTFNTNTYQEWFEKLKAKLSFKNLAIYYISNESNIELDCLCKKSMQLSCTIEDDSMYLSSDDVMISLKVEKLK